MRVFVFYSFFYLISIQIKNYSQNPHHKSKSASESSPSTSICRNFEYPECPLFFNNIKANTIISPKRTNTNTPSSLREKKGLSVEVGMFLESNKTGNPPGGIGSGYVAIVSSYGPLERQYCVFGSLEVGEVRAFCADTVKSTATEKPNTSGV